MPETSERPVRLYTRARKFPKLIGKTLDGRQLPGGPYTGPQLILTGSLVFLAVKTAPLWARGSGVQTIVVFVALAAGSLVLGRHLPRLTRNPLLLLLGLGRVLTGPRHGRAGNRPLRARAPHSVKGVCLIDQRGLPLQEDLDLPPALEPRLDLTHVPSAALESEPDPADVSPPPTTTHPVPLSRVATLLSQAVSGDRDA